jgi:hypothetical protein
MRTLVLHPDYDTCLCWHDEVGCGLADEQTFPLSDDTRKQLQEFYLWWSELFNSDSVVSMTDWRLLDERGLEIWQRLLVELGTAYHVHFYSQQFKETFEDPDEFRSHLSR